MGLKSLFGIKKKEEPTMQPISTPVTATPAPLMPETNAPAKKEKLETVVKPKAKKKK